MNSAFNIIDKIFSSYDKLIYSVTPGFQILISLSLIAILILSIFGILRRGHWIFLLIFVIVFPGGWSALKNVYIVISTLIRALLIRAQINL